MPDPERPFPHVALATFCERVIQDKADDVMSVIRLYDAITVPATARGQFADLTAAISLRSGEARGTYNIEFLFHPPGGAARVRLPTPGSVTFLGDEQGVTFGLQIHTMLHEPGLYWLDLQVEGRVLTRIPLRINYAAGGTETS
jgi:Family of unknown function (DUF6941)